MGNNGHSLWANVVLLGVILLSTFVSAHKKVLVTKIRFGIVPKEFQHNVTAVLEGKSQPVHGLSAWSVTDGIDAQPFNGEAGTSIKKIKSHKKTKGGWFPKRDKKGLAENVDRIKETFRTKDNKSKSFLLDIITRQPNDSFGTDQQIDSRRGQNEHAIISESTSDLHVEADETDGVPDVTEKVQDNGRKITYNTSALSKIVGGSQSYPNGWPSEASVQYLGSDGYWYHFCGGSLIHTEWVVTVAHCLVKLEDYIIRIVLGDYRLGSLDGREQIASPSNIFVHTYFNQPEWSYDIGLIKLQHPVTQNSYVQVGEMAASFMEPFGNNHDCYVAGWGSVTGQISELETPDYLQQTQMTVITKQECRRQLHIKDVLVDSHICIENEMSSVCIGDSGSPLECRVDDRWVLVGLASWIRDENCEPSVPNVFTRISSYYSWCLSVIDQY